MWPVSKFSKTNRSGSSHLPLSKILPVWWVQIVSFRGSKPPFHISFCIKSVTKRLRLVFYIYCSMIQATWILLEYRTIILHTLFGLLQTLKGPNLISSTHIPYPNIPSPNPPQESAGSHKPSYHIAIPWLELEKLVHVFLTYLFQVYKLTLLYVCLTVTIPLYSFGQVKKNV